MVANRGNTNLVVQQIHLFHDVIDSRSFVGMMVGRLGWKLMMPSQPSISIPPLSQVRRGEGKGGDLSEGRDLNQKIGGSMFSGNLKYDVVLFKSSGPRDMMKWCIGRKGKCMNL